MILAILKIRISIQTMKLKVPHLTIILNDIKIHSKTGEYQHLFLLLENVVQQLINNSQLSRSFNKMFSVLICSFRFNPTKEIGVIADLAELHQQIAVSAVHGICYVVLY